MDGQNVAAWAAAAIAVVASAISALQARAGQHQANEARRQADAAERATIFGEQQLQLIRDQLAEGRLERRSRERAQQLDAIDALIRSHWELFLRASALNQELFAGKDQDATREAYVLARHNAQAADIRVGRVDKETEFGQVVGQIRDDRATIDGLFGLIFAEPTDRVSNLDRLEGALQSSNDHMFVLSRAAAELTEALEGLD